MTAREALAEMRRIVGKQPGYEPESLQLQPAMVNVHSLEAWAAAIEAELATEAERRFLEAAKAHFSGEANYSVALEAYRTMLAEREKKEAV